jgi:hypothetical protein
MQAAAANSRPGRERRWPTPPSRAHPLIDLRTPWRAPLPAGSPAWALEDHAAKHMVPAVYVLHVLLVVAAFLLAFLLLRRLHAAGALRCSWLAPAASAPAEPGVRRAWGSGAGAAGASSGSADSSPLVFEMSNLAGAGSGKARLLPVSAPRAPRHCITSDDEDDGGALALGLGAGVEARVVLGAARDQRGVYKLVPGAFGGGGLGGPGDV